MGLLRAKKEIVPEDILYPTHDLDDFKGGMAENYVCTQLTAVGYSNYYWSSNRGSEVDFIIQREGKIIPIEIKAADHTRAKSLELYVKAFNPDYSIKLSTKNFGRGDGQVSVPFYGAFCI